MYLLYYLLVIFLLYTTLSYSGTQVLSVAISRGCRIARSRRRVHLKTDIGCISSCIGQAGIVVLALVVAKDRLDIHRARNSCTREWANFFFNGMAGCWDLDAGIVCISCSVGQAGIVILAFAVTHDRQNIHWAHNSCTRKRAFIFNGKATNKTCGIGQASIVIDTSIAFTTTNRINIQCYAGQIKWDFELESQIRHAGTGAFSIFEG